MKTCMKAVLTALVACSLIAGSSVSAQCQTDQLSGSGNPVGTWSNHSLDIDGDTLAVGHWFIPFFGDLEAGVYVFFRQGGAWQEQAHLSEVTTRDEPFSYFGMAVALDGDRLAVGAPLESVQGTENVGSVFLYVRSAGVWTLEEQLIPADPAFLVFGDDVALNGDTLVVGHGVDSYTPGHAHVYRLTAGVWTPEAVLNASDAVPGKPDYFGMTLELVGDTLFVGAPQGYDEPPGTGEVYVFERTGSTWTEVQALHPDESEGRIRFGTSLDCDGTRLAIGAPEGPVAQAIYIFERSGGSWVRAARLEEPGPGNSGGLGISVALRGERLIAGAPGDQDSMPLGTGAVYVFDHLAGEWTPTDKLYAISATTPPGGDFGLALDWDGGALGVLNGLSACLFAIDDPACPRADFRADPTFGQSPLTVDFNDVSAGTVTGWSWLFGDGASDTIGDPSHTYASSGRYKVVLTASGPAGADREIKLDYVEVQVGASMSVRNGSGVNPLCYANASPPVLGSLWTATVDASSHPGALNTIVFGYPSPATGPVYPYGEWLVSRRDPRLFVSLAVPDPFTLIATHSHLLPSSVGLVGVTLSTQAAILGGSFRLCNAVDLLLGY